MDSDTESEEEVNDLMREAANCDYVNNLYNNSYNEKSDKSKGEKNLKADQEEPNLSSHQVFLSKSLSKKLDSLIKIVEVDDAYVEPRIRKNFDKGIRLLKNSVLIDEPEIEEVLQKKVSPNKNDVSEKERTLRAKEAAVTPEWVLEKSNTAFWKFYKPKIIFAKGDESSNGKIACSVVSKTF